jgi:hypothetical protein
MAGFTIEPSSTVGLSDSALATLAGVSESVITHYRAGLPHWTLERPGVMAAIATATQTDLNLMKANFDKAKTRAAGLRGHGTAGPGGFPGQIWPSFRV